MAIDLAHNDSRNGTYAPAPVVTVPAQGSAVTGQGASQANAHAARVLYVHNSADIYGASRALVRLVRTIDRTRVAPTVVIPSDGPLRQMLEAHGIEVILEPSLCVIDRASLNWKGIRELARRFVVSVFRLTRLILQRRVTVVHTNTGVILSASIAALIARVPHVWHIRESFQEFERVWPFFSRYILQTSRWVIAVSGPVARQFPRSRKVVVVHDALDLNEFEVDRNLLRAEYRSSRGLTNETIVGCVGRIKFGRKGQEVLVRAAAILKGRGISAKYLIVGTTADGNEQHLTDLLILIDELGLQDDVIIAGELADVRPAYAAMDLLVMPSAQPEPLGLVVLEAMAFGLPVVATRLGGPLETVEDGQTGFLVAPADPEALAQSLARLLMSPALRQEMGAAGRVRVANRFAVRPMSRALETIYREASKRQ